MYSIAFLMALGGGMAAPVQVEADDQEGQAPATIVVRLPADAELFVDGNRTQSTTSERRLATPPLEEGRTYHYTLEGRVVRNGRTVIARGRVAVRAGKVTRVRLNFPEEAEDSSTGDSSPSYSSGSTSNYTPSGGGTSYSSGSSSSYSPSSNGTSYSSGGSTGGMGNYSGNYGGSFAGSGQPYTSGGGGSTGSGFYAKQPIKNQNGQIVGYQNVPVRPSSGYSPRPGNYGGSMGGMRYGGSSGGHRRP